jgi:hypothetical protein
MPTDFERWMNDAEALEATEVRNPGIPIGTALLEAETVAHFVTTYWEPSADGKTPGLSALGGRIKQTMTEDITSLVGACRFAQAKVLFPEGVNVMPALVVEAEKILADVGAAIEYLLDDDVDEPADDAFAVAKKRKSEDATRATLVQTLVDYAHIADAIKDRLATLAGFSMPHIDRMKELAAAIGAAGVPGSSRSETKSVDVRNRLLTLLGRQVDAVRRAARYIFRDHPDILRKATSAYQRKRRLEAKRSKAAESGTEKTE